MLYLQGMQRLSKSEGISYQTLILKIMKLLSRQKSKNLKCLGEDLTVIFVWVLQKVIVIEISTQIAKRNFTCKECEDEVNEKGYFVKHQYSLM